MEDDNRKEEINEVTGGGKENETAGQRESGTSNQYQHIPRTPASRKRTRDESVT